MNLKWILGIVLVLVLVGTVSAATITTIYPTIDGIAQESTDSAYSTLRNDVGDNSGSGGLTYYENGYLAAASSGTDYTLMKRGIFSFNTSEIPDTDNIDSVVFSVCVTAKTNLLGSPYYGITGGTLISNTSIAAGDYNGFSQTMYSDTNISYASISTSGRNNWTLNDAGETAINKTGYTVIYLRDSWDINDSFSGTYSNSLYNYLRVIAVGCTTESYRPFIEVTHSPTASAPVAAFSANVTYGLSPLTVQFTDASTNSPDHWNWTFGDGSTTDNDEQSPVHTYTTNGTFTVNMTSWNSAGSDDESKTWYIETRGFNHPITLNITDTPGYLNSGVEPWKTMNTTLFLWVNGDGFSTSGLEWDYVAADSESERDDAMQMAVAYAITKNTTFANKTVEALLYLNTDIGNVTDDESTENAPGDYAIAYDLIAQTWNVNSTLDNTNDTIIRNNLALVADTAYKNRIGKAFYVNDINDPVTYVSIAMTGEVLDDWVNTTNTSRTTTPAQWKVLGEDGLWVNDPLDREAYTALTNEDKGLMSILMDYQSGANLMNSYKSYYDMSLIRYMRVWSYIHGTNYTDTYPLAKDWAMTDTWQSLPMGYFMPNTGSDGNSARNRSMYLIPILDSTNQSILKRYDNIQNNAYTNDIYFNPTYIGSTFATSFGANLATNGYLFFPDTSTISPVAPTYTNTLKRNGSYYVFREDWTNQSDWLGYKLTTEKFTPSSRNQLQADSMGFEYASHGDLLMPGGSESKYGGNWSLGNNFPIQQSTLMFGNGTVPFPAMNYISGNVTFQGAVSSYASPYHRAKNDIIIDNSNVSYVGSTFSNVTLGNYTELPDGSDYLRYAAPRYPSVPINFSRNILYPFKDYPIIVDRANSAKTYEYVNNFRFGSLKLTPASGAVDYETGENMGHVNGTLGIGATTYDWTTPGIGVYVDTGTTTNTINWNTTSPYGDDVNLTLFSAPSSDIHFEKHFTRISTYQGSATIGTDTESDVLDTVAIPDVMFYRPENKTLYRVTALLSKYANESARTPTELTVTGTGSAIKVVNGTTTDRIYTGLGNSTFDGIETDADTVFLRQNATHFTYALIVNGSYLAYGATPLINTGSVEDSEEYGGGAEAAITPVASFTKSRSIVRIPQTVVFTDTSTNTPTSWNWDLGDRSVNITTQNATYKYSKRGTYTINFTATNSAGSNSTIDRISVLDNRRFGIGLPTENKLEYVSCNEVTYYSSRELTEQEQIMTDNKYIKLCEV